MHTIHSLRTSLSFSLKWSTFTSNCIGELHQNPILVQYVTDKFFQRFIQCQFSLADEAEVLAQQQALTYEESNALHYTAGAVCCTQYNSDDDNDANVTGNS